jgi:hypothetical protein
MLDMAIATTPASELATDAGFQGWLQTGHALLTQRNEVEWKLADWIADGREQFGDQAAFDFLADELGIAPKKLKTAASVAKAFPPSHRDPSLTFEHYESVATLPVTDALSLLRDAKANHWDDRETRVEAVRRRAQISTTTLLDDDFEYQELIAISRAWNRARPDVRSQFLELAAEANLGVIDA